MKAKETRSPGQEMKKKDPTSHRIIEKRRRDRMNNCLADLSRLIPAYYLKKRTGRVEKTEIIEMAIKHLKDLIETTNAQQRLLDQHQLQLGAPHPLAGDAARSQQPEVPIDGRQMADLSISAEPGSTLTSQQQQQQPVELATNQRTADQVEEHFMVQNIHNHYHQHNYFDQRLDRSATELQAASPNAVEAGGGRSSSSSDQIGWASSRNDSGSSDSMTSVTSNTSDFITGSDSCLSCSSKPTMNGFNSTSSGSLNCHYGTKDGDSARRGPSSSIGRSFSGGLAWHKKAWLIRSISRSP